MWQRIQTLYLMISAALCAALLFGTAYKVADPEGMLEVSYFQLQKPFFAILLCILHSPARMRLGTSTRKSDTTIA